MKKTALIIDPKYVNMCKVVSFAQSLGLDAEMLYWDEDNCSFLQDGIGDAEECNDKPFKLTCGMMFNEVCEFSRITDENDEDDIRFWPMLEAPPLTKRDDNGE